MGEPIVSKMSQTIMKYTQENYTLQHLQNTRPEWLPGNTYIDWKSYDRWNARMKSATRRAANKKHLWDMHMTEEYIKRKFSKGGGMCRCADVVKRWKPVHMFYTTDHAKLTP
jgi:hypothetical protein